MSCNGAIKLQRPRCLGTLNEEWNEIISVIKNSKQSVLQNFSFSIDSCMNAKRVAKTKKILNFVNNEAKIVDVENKVTECIETLSLIEKTNCKQILFTRYEKSTNKKIASKFLTLYKNDNIYLCEYVKNKNGNVEKFEFAINKKHQVAHFKQIAEKTK